MRETYCWRLELENGDVRMGEFRPEQLRTLRQHAIDEHAYCEVAFDWNDRLPCGYHRYKLEARAFPSMYLLRSLSGRVAAMSRLLWKTAGVSGARPCSCIRFVRA